MKKLIASLFIFFTVSSGFTQPTHHSFTIVAFGTSLTYGSQIEEEKWTTILQKILRERHPQVVITVINAGICGSSTRDRLLRIEKDVLDRHPDLIIQDFGINDANYEPERHVYLDEFEQNIQTMHNQVVSKTGAAEIYWPNTPINSESHVWRNQPLYVEAGGLEKYAEKYRKCAFQMSRKLHVTFVDVEVIFRKKFKEYGMDHYLQPDGIHFLKAGNQLMAESLLPLVEKVMKKRLN
jgi:lysophospholipase L1-like esterase